MSRVLLVVVVTAVVGLVLSAPKQAAAYDTWCADDPIVSIGGHLLDVQVQMPVNRLLTMRSTTLTIVIPKNVTGFVVVDDISAFPMSTSVQASGPHWNGKGSIPITIIAFVQASATYPVRVTATPLLNTGSAVSGVASTLNSVIDGPATATGTSNSTLVLPYRLGS